MFCRVFCVNLSPLFILTECIMEKLNFYPKLPIRFGLDRTFFFNNIINVIFSE